MAANSYQVKEIKRKWYVVKNGKALYETAYRLRSQALCARADMIKDDLAEKDVKEESLDPAKAAELKGSMPDRTGKDFGEKAHEKIAEETKKVEKEKTVTEQDGPKKKAQTKSKTKKN